MVVEQEAARWREELRPLETQFFGKASSRRRTRTRGFSFEVVDRSHGGFAPAAGRIRRGQSVVAREPRACIPPETGRAMALSASEQNRARHAREQHARRVKDGPVCWPPRK